MCEDFFVDTRTNNKNVDGGEICVRFFVLWNWSPVLSSANVLSPLDDENECWLHIDGTHFSLEYSLFTPSELIEYYHFSYACIRICINQINWIPFIKTYIISDSTPLAAVKWCVAGAYTISIHPLNIVQTHIVFCKRREWNLGRVGGVQQKNQIKPCKCSIKLYDYVENEPKWTT